eukprot:TRINITY_DN8043_c0_g1_i1.p1 TRINITY_DN8043_c0_g1~~TRINITY_DN8043_c0_g1_i1.p1  ORF type:complete len:366 (-),score=91.24 TRINITY_DN8043_c0_g1_i1:110-1207(-)
MTDASGRGGGGDEWFGTTSAASEIPISPPPVERSHMVSIPLGTGDISFDEDLSSSTPSSSSTSSSSTSTFASLAGDSVQGQIAARVADNVFSSTKSKAAGFFNIYANIDLIRPYFDVEPVDVLKRLGCSLVPMANSPLLEEKGADLYGPVMLMFTLSAILLLGMKLSDAQVHEGSLVGSSLAVSFSYWLGASLCFYLASYLLSVTVTLVQILSIVGYGLFGACLSLIVHMVVPSLPWFVALLPALMAALSMGYAFYSKAAVRRDGLIIAAIVISVHVFFYLYLQVSYATLYQTMASALQAGGVTAAGEQVIDNGGMAREDDDGGLLEAGEINDNADAVVENDGAMSDHAKDTAPVEEVIPAKTSA